MRKLLNTLYIIQEKAYLSLEGENIVIYVLDEIKFRIPFVNIEGIVCFNYLGCSPALMAKCAENGVSLCFMRPSGRFLAKVVGKVKGNVHLRRIQYECLRDEIQCLKLAKNVVAAKISNSRQLLLKFLRDHKEISNYDELLKVADTLKANINKVMDTNSIDTLRGIEGESAKDYFSIFGDLILNKDSFNFEYRSKRPPLDKVNALLSYLYTILTFDVESALESVGLDPYIGFLHTDRSGRASLANDMVEELRTLFVDRFVLSLINLHMIDGNAFVVKEGGGIIMDDDLRKLILSKWQERKKEEIYHAVIKEKIPLGLLPYVQAQLLAKYFRNEIDDYIPFCMEG